mmetsp:Transcript_51811/g.130123  ORF Transcript_51811/g.130123 Transcript_51811/m.130123 type:complete len:226 (+) Transcript_51811:1289-1966(+)
MHSHATQPPLQLQLPPSDEVTTRDHPVEFEFGCLEVEELHVNAVLAVGVSPQIREVKRYPRSQRYLAEIVMRVVISIDALSEGEPCGFPHDLLGLGLLLDGAVGLGDPGAVDPQGLGRTVEHLLELGKRQVTHDQLVTIRLHPRSVVTEFLQKWVVLWRYVIGELDGGGDLGRDLCGHAILVTRELTILLLPIGTPIRTVMRHDVPQGTTHRRTNRRNSRILECR